MDPKKLLGKFLALSKAELEGLSAAPEGLLSPEELQLRRLAKNLYAAQHPGGLQVYHGSPHVFDQFDFLGNISRGEGAQAYGPGGRPSAEIIQQERSFDPAAHNFVRFDDGTLEILKRENKAEGGRVTA